MGRGRPIGKWSSESLGAEGMRVIMNRVHQCAIASIAALSCGCLMLPYNPVAEARLYDLGVMASPSSSITWGPSTVTVHNVTSPIDITMWSVRGDAVSLSDGWTSTLPCRIDVRVSSQSGLVYSAVATQLSVSGLSCSSATSGCDRIEWRTNCRFFFPTPGKYVLEGVFNGIPEALTNDRNTCIGITWYRPNYYPKPWIQ
jgi:hypothetical protein